MWQSSRSLMSFLSGKAKTWSKGMENLSCAAGRFMRQWAAACPELSPSCLLLQLQRHNYTAGKAPAINTYLLKYLENLEVWGSGCLACQCLGTEVKLLLSLALLWAGMMSQKEQWHQCVERRQTFRTVRQWNMRVKGKVQGRGASRFEEGHARRNEAFSTLSDPHLHSPLHVLAPHGF